MPKETSAAEESFGQRLARLRKAAGFTQTELAEEISGTRRMIAYYETESEYPPTTLLTAIAGALKVTTDELLGAAPSRKAVPIGNARLQRRLQQLEKLAPQEKRQVMTLLDAFIERAQLKQASR